MTCSVTPGVNANFSGVQVLPGKPDLYLKQRDFAHRNGSGETIVADGCANSVSVFDVDYDAEVDVAQPVQLALLPLFGRSSL